MTSPSDKINNSPDDSSTVNLYQFRGDEAAECMLENCVRSLLLTPIDGEYAISPTAKRWNGNETNTSAGGKVGDFALSIKQAFEHFPLVESVTIQVPWYAEALEWSSASVVQVEPGVISRDTAFDDSAEPWSQTIMGNSYNRAGAVASFGSVVRVLTQSRHKGTPSEQSMKDAIAEIKSYGKKVILQPIVLVDIAGDHDSREIFSNNPDLSGSVVFNNSNLDTYGCFLMDMVNIAKDTGCESIIVGTGMSGLSKVTRFWNAAFEDFLSIAKGKLTGTDAPKIGLACDLDEITALTRLFSNANVDYIAFNYQPALGSWTDDPDAQTPAQQSAQSIYDLDYLRSHITPPVADGVVPADKQIVLHNIGCRSIHRAANAPASDSPPATNGNQDNLMQRAYIEAILSYFRDMPQYDLTRSSVAAWDIRLHSQIHIKRPADIPAWRNGFILNGKVQVPPPPASAFGNYDYCNSDTDIIIDGRVYESAAIKGEGIKRVGAFTNKTQTLSLPRNSPVILALRDGRHPVPITLTIKQGHITESGYSNFRTIWAGRVTGVSRVKHEVTIEGRAFSMGLGRIGVNERYNQGCGHALHFGRCRATRKPITATATNADGNNSINVAHSLTGTDRNLTLADWKNGTVSWRQGTQTISARITLAEATGSGTLVHLARPAPTWESGVDVTLLVGCNHTKENCHRLHSNLPNYGGNPNIPDVNPFEIQPPVFY